MNLRTTVPAFFLASAFGGFSWAADFKQDELDCLARNIYWEGRSEPLSGQIAITHVTLNRVADPAFPNTICEVVYQGVEIRRGGCQFSWWCDGLSDNIAEHEAWAKALDIAEKVITHRMPDPTDGALYYHGTTVEPSWSAERDFALQIGGHYYYY